MLLVVDEILYASVAAWAGIIGDNRETGRNFTGFSNACSIFEQKNVRV